MTIYTKFDAMTGKGYGHIGRYHKQRLRNSSYPYIDPDDTDLDEDEVSSDVKQKIHKKVNIVAPINDPMSSHGVDKFYFVAGNTKLSECFENTLLVLEKVVSYARMFSPVPKLNKGKITSPGGASFSNGVGNYRRIGMTRGFSSAPPPFNDFHLEDEEEDSDGEDL